MSGAMMQQPRDENGQFVNLRDFVTTVMDERWRAHTREHQLIDTALRETAALRQEALSQARLVVDSRLEKLNDLRAEVVKDRAEYLTRTEFELQVNPLQKFREKALGFGAVLSIISAVTGSVLTALVLRLF